MYVNLRPSGLGLQVFLNYNNSRVMLYQSLERSHLEIPTVALSRIGYEVTLNWQSRLWRGNSLQGCHLASSLQLSARGKGILGYVTQQVPQRAQQGDTPRHKNVVKQENSGTSKKTALRTDNAGYLGLSDVKPTTVQETDYEVRKPGILGDKLPAYLHSATRDNGS
ncbi:hypothetical protein J6590_019525 [Homalodisca vitripennis]|nr:hypothetical protein J6590_019525 [Homalodisca vitripennis]